MRLVEVVFEKEIVCFGLKTKEIVEIAKKVMSETDDIRVQLGGWDEKGNFRFVVRASAGQSYLENHPEEFVKYAMREMEKFFKKLESKIMEYRHIKPYLAIYNKNGKSTVEVFEKAGIDVIS